MSHVKLHALRNSVLNSLGELEAIMRTEFCHGPDRIAMKGETLGYKIVLEKMNNLFPELELHAATDRRLGSNA